MTFEQFWHHVRVILESLWGHVGVTFGPFWGHVPGEIYSDDLRAFRTLFGRLIAGWMDRWICRVSRVCRVSRTNWVSHVCRGCRVCRVNDRTL